MEKIYETSACALGLNKLGFEETVPPPSPNPIPTF